MVKRSIYRTPEGNLIDRAVKQYQVTEDAFYDHLEKVRKLQLLIDSLTDAQFNEYLERTQPK